MKVAFLNLCHCDADVVSRVAKKLTKNPNFHMYIHVDKKVDDRPFKEKMKNCKNIFFIENRQKVYWGGFNAILATLELMKAAIESGENYDRYMLLQNLDYPLKSNEYIEDFFEKNKEVEFIRACKIGKTKDWHFKEKYKINNKFDDDFYTKKHSKIRKIMHNGFKVIKSYKTFFFNGIIKDNNKEYPLYYGSAQWALTKDCVKYILDFYSTHNKFNKIMMHIKFPDEEYFQTIVHNSKFKYKCSKYDEPEQRWLVNWRNLHYYEYPKEITVFKDEDFNKLKERNELFCRKVRTGVSDSLMDKLDNITL